MKIELLQNLSIFWAMLHVLVLFILLFRPRFTKKKTMLIAGGGISVLMILNIAILIYWGFDVISKVFFFTCSVPSFIFFYLLSQDKKFRFLLTFCLADTTCLWVMAVTNLMDYFFGGGRYILMFISRIVLFPLLEYLIYHFLRKPYLELQNAVKTGWGVFAGMTMLYYVLLVVVVQYPTNIVNRPEDMFLCILVLILMLFNYATIFLALYRQLLLYRKQQSVVLLKEQKNSLELQLDNQKRIRKMKHDMKGHVLTLSGLLVADNIEEALEYLENLGVEMDTLTGQFCENPYINAVLVQYDRKFFDLNVRCRVDIQIGAEVLPYMEVCQILANSLENACDALKELPLEEREASIQMKYRKDYLIIRVKNRCSEDLHVDRGAIPPTKKEGSDHGFGLLTIKEAAQRLKGDMMCYTDNRYFVLDVTVRVKQDDEHVCMGKP